MNLLLTMPENELAQHRFQPHTLQGHILHLPLGGPQAIEASPEIDEAISHFKQYQNIVLADEYSTGYFFELLPPRITPDEVNQHVFYARTSAVAHIASGYNFPTIQPLNGTNAIDVVETMLRFRRIGPTLIPVHRHHPVEISGLLEELGIPVNELAVWKDKELDASTTEIYRQKVAQQSPDTILFHTESSVNTLPALFQSIHFETTTNIALGNRIARKMAEHQLPVSHILETLEELNVRL